MIMARMAEAIVCIVSAAQVRTFYLPQIFIHLLKFLTFNAEYDSDNLPGMAEAENMADLVDGYCRLVNQSSTSIWSRKGIETTCLENLSGF